MLAVVCGGVRPQLQAGQDHAEEQPAAVLAADEVRVLALPADSRRLRQRLFHYWRSVDEHLQLGGRLANDEPGERLQRLLYGLVVVAALRIGRDPAEFGMRAKRQRIG